MADKKDDKLTEDLTSEVVKVAAEIVSLKTVTNKLVAFGQRDSDRQTATAEKEQTERIDFLKQEIAAGDGRTKAIRALKFEMVGIETSIQDQANTNAEILANSAAALGMTEEEFKIQQSLQADSDRTNANLEKLGQQLMEAGIKPEDLMGIESYAEMSADAAEKQESVSIEALRNQPSEAAATENAEEAKADQKNQQTLLSKIAGGLGGLLEQGKDKLKSAGKGVMAILKGTLIAGFALAMVAFLNSKYWEDTKKVIVEDILPGLMKVFGFLKENAEAIAIGFASIVGAIAIVKFVAILQKIKLAFITMKTAMLATKASLVTTLAPLLPIIAVAAAIALVISALKAGFDDFKKTLEETGSIFEALKVGVAKTIGFLFGLPIEFILKAVGFIAGLFGFEGLKEKLNAMNPIQAIADGIKLLFDEIQHIFTVLPPKLGEALSNIATNAIEAIKAILPSMEDLKAMLPSFDGLKNFFGFGGDDEPEGKSKGGPIKAGVPYLVGEKGPELIVPGAASMVFPTEKTADIRTQQINQAGVERSGGGGGSPVVVDAKSTNVVNSNSSSSATFTSTSLQHPNPLIKTLNYAF